MRKLLLLLSVLTGIVAVVFFYQRFFLLRTFGPSSMLGTAVLLLVFLVFLITYVLYNTRYKTTVAKIWLAGFSVLFTYALVDLAAGFFLITPLSPTLVPDQYRHHKLVPDSYSKLEQRDFSYIQRVNNVGMRGPDIEPRKPEGVYRILMLGDSFTMGKGVEDDETFSALLQQSLNSRPSECESKKIEVLNGGVDSYAPILYYLQLSRDLARLEPDLVVVNLDVSDLVQETAYRNEGIIGPDGEIVAVPGAEGRKLLNERIRGWIDQNLFLTRLLLFHTNKLLKHKDLSVRDVVTQANYEVVAYTLAEDREPRDQQWHDLFESLLRIKKFCDENGMDFVLSVYPWAHQVSDTEWVPGRFTFMPKNATPTDNNLHILQTFAAENGVDLANLFPAFRSYRGEAPLFFSHDMHWTVAGNRVMADGLQGLLEQRFGQDWCRHAPPQEPS